MATAKRRASDKTASAVKPAFNVDLLNRIVTATNANSFIYTKGEDNAAMLVSGLIEVNNALKNDAGEVATRATADGVAYVAALPKDENSEADAANDAANSGAVVINNQSETEGNSNMNQNVATMSAATLAVTASSFAIDNDIPPPSGSKRRVGGEKYPFDALQPGQSFFVPATDDNPNPAKSLASTVSSATARYAVEVPGETETVTRHVYKTDEGGKRVKGEDGSYIKTGQVETATVPKMQNTRVFMVRPVDETAQGRGKGARVWRTA
jgi:hypothetical protein